jgi:hypothetical protein
MGEENEVFEASIEVGFLFQTHDLLKVRVVDVCIHSEQALEYCLDHVSEINREWSTCQCHTSHQEYTKGIVNKQFHGRNTSRSL